MRRNPKPKELAFYYKTLEYLVAFERSRTESDMNEMSQEELLCVGNITVYARWLLELKAEKQKFLNMAKIEANYLLKQGE